MVHYRGGRAAIDPDVYPDLDEFWDDLAARVRRARCAAWASSAARYLQLDDTSLAYLNDPAQRADGRRARRRRRAPARALHPPDQRRARRPAGGACTSPPTCAAATSAPPGRPRAAIDPRQHGRAVGRHRGDCRALSYMAVLSDARDPAARPGARRPGRGLPGLPGLQRPPGLDLHGRQRQPVHRIVPGRNGAPGRPDAPGRRRARCSAIPLLILLVPIFDTIFVSVTRRMAGRSPMLGGRDHVSHRLVALGIDERRAVHWLYGLAALGGVVAVTLQRTEVGYAAILIALYSSCSPRMRSSWAMSRRTPPKPSAAHRRSSRNWRIATGPTRSCSTSR